MKNPDGTSRFKDGFLATARNDTKGMLGMTGVGRLGMTGVGRLGMTGVGRLGMTTALVNAGRAVRL